MFSRILVPTDGSASSETAGRAAIALARGCGAYIVAVSIAQPGSPSCDGADPRDGGPGGCEAAMHAAAQRAGKIARLAQEAGVPARVVTAVASSEYEEIIRIAGELQCDLIFMATHGQGGLTRLIAGRVPQLVLAYSPVPVMLYRGSVLPA
ncbi:universal stress protein [Massilia sp. ST3]|uniref:universal stress protein n=1 Tax=Massilia sp. ST3 TaxID=2824903 RepID=UPI001B832E88|nr:universal stress protein [Massilia sp. ST3]MBQ5948491.1 universal stress protein [Massilia sp. ST3]